MFHLYLLCLMLCITNIASKSDEFVCPKDGRWPHPTDCEKYYTCTSGISVEGWCGLAMSYDPDHQRCDLTKNIECQNGERPSWTPPEGWGQSESVTSYVITKTTASADDFFELDKETRASKKRKTTTTKPTTKITKLARNLVTLAVSQLVEDSVCSFQANMPDPENCQFYYTCKEDVVVHAHCPERQLFDEDTRVCSEYRKVFCGNRPTNERGNDPCVGEQNGWYADSETQCRSYYLCAEQRKAKMGECGLGLKWNSQRLRCDDPKNIPAPCGIRANGGNSLSRQHHSTIILVSFFTLLTFQQIILCQ